MAIKPKFKNVLPLSEYILRNRHIVSPKSKKHLRTLGLKDTYIPSIKTLLGKMESDATGEYLRRSKSDKSDRLSERVKRTESQDTQVCDDI